MEKPTKVQEVKCAKVVPKGFLKLVSECKIWDFLKEFLDGKDVVSLLNVQPIRCFIIKDLQIFAHVERTLNIPIAPPIISSKEPAKYTMDQQHINILIDKYVTQAYVTGKQMDSRLKLVIKTLLGLQRSSDTSNIPQNLFNSVAELVGSKFPFDKTIELLNKSTSQFSRNADTMKDWIIYLHNSLAGLLYDGAITFIEVSVFLI